MIRYITRYNPSWGRVLVLSVVLLTPVGIIWQAPVIRMLNEIYTISWLTDYAETFGALMIWTCLFFFCFIWALLSFFLTLLWAFDIVYLSFAAFRKYVMSDRGAQR